MFACTTKSSNGYSVTSPINWTTIPLSVCKHERGIHADESMCDFAKMSGDMTYYISQIKQAAVKLASCKTVACQVTRCKRSPSFHTCLFSRHVFILASSDENNAILKQTISKTKKEERALHVAVMCLLKSLFCSKLPEEDDKEEKVKEDRNCKKPCTFFASCLVTSFFFFYALMLFDFRVKAWSSKLRSMLRGPSSVWVRLTCRCNASHRRIIWGCKSDLVRLHWKAPRCHITAAPQCQHSSRFELTRQNEDLL